MKTYPRNWTIKKSISFVLIMLFFATMIMMMVSCTKCGECTRVYSSESYTLNPDGSKTDVQSLPNYSTETFDVCGNQEIKNAEQTVVQQSHYDMGNGQQHVSIITATCNCTMK